MSVVDYADVIYRHAAPSTLKRLDPVYHSALRFITGDPFNTHHCDLYSEVGWSSLQMRRDFHWHLFIYKALLEKLPSYLTELLHISFNNQCHTRSSDRLLLHVPRVSLDWERPPFPILLLSPGTDYRSSSGLMTFCLLGFLEILF